MPLDFLTEVTQSTKANRYLIGQHVTSSMWRYVPQSNHNISVDKQHHVHTHVKTRISGACGFNRRGPCRSSQQGSQKCKSARGDPPHTDSSDAPCDQCRFRTP